MKSKAGWELKQSKLIPFLETDVMRNITLSFLNSKSRKTTSYKFALFKSLLDNLFNVSSDLIINLEEINYTFAKIYWNIINLYKLPQVRPNSQFNLSSVEIIVYNIIKENELTLNVEFDSLNDVIKKQYLKNVFIILKKDVVGSLCKEFELKFFEFDLQCENPFIKFSNEAFHYLKENKIVLEKLNYFYWIFWIEEILIKSEREDGNLANKLDSSTKRRSLNKFREDIYKEEEEVRCFYCEKVVSKRDVEIDHFVPWSFVKDDKIWNLVPSCKKCNGNKSDKIMSEKYLEKLIARNNEKSYNNKFNLETLYKSALFNGFTLLDSL